MNEGPGRPVRWQELSKSECFELLARQQLGRVAVVDDRGPIVFPVNFVLDRHTVVFRTAEGTKLDAASTGPRVAFEVDGTDAPARTGWSVVVRGEAVEVTGPAELARLRALLLRPWVPGARNDSVWATGPARSPSSPGSVGLNGERGSAPVHAMAPGPCRRPGVAGAR
jgi:nitroimidazol reductase NimA-like FMN-containing flavoprotein (pyridoxamine 5'-phosphate oxidase superfamily)